MLLVRAMAVEVLLLTDTHYGAGAISADQRCWTLVLWYPWFLIGGITFGMAAVAARQPSPAPEDRRPSPVLGPPSTSTTRADPERSGT